MFKWFKKNKKIEDLYPHEYAELLFMEDAYIEENLMTLKEAFLSYVERQRTANATKDAFGSDDPKTAKAYAEANDLKRKVLNMIEEMESK